MKVYLLMRREWGESLFSKGKVTAVFSEDHLKNAFIMMHFLNTKRDGSYNWIRTRGVI